MYRRDAFRLQSQSRGQLPILPIPVDQALDSFLESHSWLPDEKVAGSLDVGPGGTDIRGLRRGELKSSKIAQFLLEQPDYLQKFDQPVAPQVDDRSEGAAVSGVGPQPFRSSSVAHIHSGEKEPVPDFVRLYLV